MSLGRLSLTTLTTIGDRPEATPGQPRAKGDEQSLFERIIEEVPDQEQPGGARDEAASLGSHAKTREFAGKPGGERLSQSLDILGRDAPGDPLLRDGSLGAGAVPDKGSDLPSELQPAVATAEQAVGSREVDPESRPDESTSGADPSYPRHPLMPTPLVAGQGKPLVASDRAAASQSKGAPTDAVSQTKAQGIDRSGLQGRQSAGLPADLTTAFPVSASAVASPAAGPILGTAPLRAGASRSGEILSTREVTSSLQSLVVTRRETHFAVSAPRDMALRGREGLPEADVPRPDAAIDPRLVETRTRGREERFDGGQAEIAVPINDEPLRTAQDTGLRPPAQRVLEAISARLSPQDVPTSSAKPAFESWPVTSGGPLKILGLQLEPGTLGRVDVELAFRDGVLNVSLRTATSTAAQQIEQDKNALGKALESHGYLVEDIVVMRAEMDTARSSPALPARGHDHANADERLNPGAFSGGAEANGQGQSGRQHQPRFEENVSGELVRRDETDSPAARDPVVRSGLII